MSARAHTAARSWWMLLLAALLGVVVALGITASAAQAAGGSAAGTQTAAAKKPKKVKPRHAKPKPRAAKPKPRAAKPKPRAVRVQMANPPQPTYGTASVDGSTSEWNLTTDFFANMYRAGRNDANHPVESKLYLRYDCATGTVYVLVLAEPGVTVRANQPSDAYVKIGSSNSPRVDGNSGDNGNPPDFRWVGQNGSTAQGYEASFSWPEGSWSNLNVHVQVNHDGSQTSAVLNRAISLVIACPAPQDLTVTKTATASFTRTFGWTIDKSVTTPALVTTDDATADFGYQVQVTKSAGTDSAWKIAGTITVTNPNWFAVGGVDVSDSLPGASCAITGSASNQTVPAGGTKQFDYTCTFASKPTYDQARTNTATASWSRWFYDTPHGSAQGTAQATFTAPTTLVNDTATVADDYDGAGYVDFAGQPISASQTYTYTKTVSTPAVRCRDIDNTAKVTFGTQNDTDAAEVTVCRTAADLTVTKTATASFTRTFGWTIDKSVTTPALVTTDDATADFGYQVQVTKSAGTDSAWKIAGTITVANPNSFAVSGVDVTDSLPGASCAVTGGTSQTIPAKGSQDFAYTCTFASKPTYDQARTNTATASWSKSSYDTPHGSAQGTAQATFTAPTTLVNDTATVADDYDGAGYVDFAGQPISASQTYTYTKTVSTPAVRCRDISNTARVTFGAQSATDAAQVTVCRLAADLTVAKTATAHFTRTFGWTIDKSVVGDTTIVSDQASVPVGYQVKLTKDAGTDSAWVIDGTITVTNPNSFAVSGASINDDLPGATCVISGSQSNLTIPARGQLTRDYTCSFAAKPAYDQALTNTARAFWAKDDYGTPHGSATGTKDATFTTPTTLVNDQVTVTDAFDGGAAQQIGTPSASTTLDDQATATVPEVGCTKYDNVATITETGQTSKATVTVCRQGGDLTVSKTATPSYTRTFAWDITKAPDAPTKSTPNDTVDFLYTVTATKGQGTDSAWTVTGTITVTNPNTFAVEGVDVVDSLGQDASCQVTDGQAATIPAGQSKDFAYTCVYAQKPAYDELLTNTATATWNQDAYVTPHGSATGTKDVTFDSAAPTTTVHPQIVVSDTFAGLADKYTLPERTITQTTTFTYTRTVDVPDRFCGDPVPNTASFVATDDAEYTGQAEASVVACRDAQPLTVAKTAVPAFTRTFGWAIAKSASPASQRVAEDQATIGYTVTVTKDQGTDAAFAVTGQITITNPNRYEVTGVDVADQIQGGPACTITGGGTGLTVPKKAGQVDGTLVLDYTCALTAKADGVNEVTVTWPAMGQEQPALAETPTETTTATVPFAFGAPTTVRHDQVDVRDAFNGGPAELIEGGAGLSASKVFTYSRTVPVPATGCTPYPNTASYTATDDATVTGQATAGAEVCRTEVQVLSPGTPAGTPTTPTTPTTPVTPVTPQGTPSRPAATRARLSIDKRAPGEITAGKVVRYTITVRNTSRVTARGVVVTDSVPSQMSLARRAAGVRMSGGVLTWRLGALAPGRARTITVDLRLDAAARGGRCNVATARATNARQVRDGACSRVIAVASATEPAVTG